MFAPRALLSLVCLSALAASAAGCGVGNAPGLASAKSRGALAARADKFEEPIVLEDFDTTQRDYDFIGPTFHPFFDKIMFTPVKQVASTSTVAEILGTASTKPRKGFYVTSDVDGEASFQREVEEGKPPITAKQVKISFRWGVNAMATTDPSMAAEVAFLFDSTRLGHKALGYAWTNRYCPGTVLQSQIGSGDEAIPMRIICLAIGDGQGAVCSEATLNKMALVPVERNFAADVRWAFSDSTKLTEPGVAVTDADAKCAPVQFPPKDFTSDPAGRAIDNTDLKGIEGLGFGAEIAKGVCAHAVVDDVKLQLKW